MVLIVSSLLFQRETEVNFFFALATTNLYLKKAQYTENFLLRILKESAKANHVCQEFLSFHLIAVLKHEMFNIQYSKLNHIFLKSFYNPVAAIGFIPFYVKRVQFFKCLPPLENTFFCVHHTSYG